MHLLHGVVQVSDSNNHSYQLLVISVLPGLLISFSRFRLSLYTMAVSCCVTAILHHLLPGKTKEKLATVHPAKRFSVMSNCPIQLFTSRKFCFTMQGTSNDILTHLQVFHILSPPLTLTAPGLPSRFLNSASCFRC